MSTMKRTDAGFTLIELLIALTISVIVAAGVYATFDSLINTKEATEDSYYKNSLLLSVRKIIKPDMLQMYVNSLYIENNPEFDVLQFETNNSIKMEKAFPVTVRYYVDDDGYLIREEKSEEHDYDWKLYLLKNVDKFDIQSHNGNTFSDDYDKMDTIIKVEIDVSGYPIIFIAGCVHPSKKPDATGDVWH